MNNFIYKICSTEEWKAAKNLGIFKGTKKDLIDGFIHFSSKKQLGSTLKKYFFKKDNLIILKVELLNLENLKWEKSQSGEIFPHLYSQLNLRNVNDKFKITVNNNGFHDLPLKL